VCKRVVYYYHWVSTQLQSTNISISAIIRLRKVQNTLTNGLFLYHILSYSFGSIFIRKKNKMVVCFVCFCSILYFYCYVYIIYSYFYVYVFLFLCIYFSGYYVSLCCSVCCSVCCLCVNLYCTTATGCKHICS
jgi:hypothetical protein